MREKERLDGRLVAINSSSIIIIIHRKYNPS